MKRNVEIHLTLKIMSNYNLYICYFYMDRKHLQPGPLSSPIFQIYVESFPSSIMWLHTEEGTATGYTLLNGLSQ